MPELGDTRVRIHRGAGPTSMADRLSIAEAREILRPVRLVTDVYFRGQQWSQRTFLPALRVLERSSRQTDRLVAGTGYYVLGDVHDFNHAPRAAIAAYRHSARLCPANAAAWREIGEICEEMGQHERAIRTLRKSIRIDSTEMWAVAALGALEDGPVSKPRYHVGDAFWLSSEFLAASRHSQAIAVLAGKRSSRADRYRARVYGAVEDANRVLGLWERIAKQKGKLEIEAADWFFLPKAVWDSQDYWRTLWKIACRVKDWNVLKGHESLCDAGIGNQERFECYLRYHLARTEHDHAAASELSKRYPQWREAAQLLKRLGGTTRRKAGTSDG